MQRSTTHVRRSLISRIAVLLASLSLVFMPTAAVAAPVEFTGVGAPTVSGSGVIGTDFTAAIDTSGVSPTPADVSLTWHRVDTGEVVQNGGMTFTAPISLLGTAVYVIATLSAPGVPSYVTLNSPFSSTVRLAEFTGVGTPTVSGSGVVGTDFTAALDTSAVSPAPTDVEFTWHRADTGAWLQYGGTTYTATNALLGTGVYVIATLGRTGVQTYVTLNSPFSSTVRLAEFTGVGTPTVSGSGVVGTDFTADLDTSAVSPAPTDVEFTWHRADTGAVVQTGGTTFTATNGLVGTGVYVIATLSRADAQTYVTANSPFSSTVRLAEFTGVGTPTVSGSGVVGTDFTAALDTSAVSPAPTDVEFTWHRADTGAVVQNGGTTFTATRDLVGTGVYVIATLTEANAQTYVTENSPFSSTVRLAEFTPGDAPTLEGHHALGETLSADIDGATWAPVPTAVSWQWYLADGTPISGATLPELALTRDLVGESVYAEARLQAPNTYDYVIATAPSGTIAAPTLSLGGVLTATPGDTVPLRVWGLRFNTEYEIELHSDPVKLATVTSAADGTLDTTVTIPASVSPGAHRIVLLEGGVEVGSIALTVLPNVSPDEGEAGDEGAGLAQTGAESIAVPALVASLIAGLGLVLLLSRRRARGHVAAE